MHRRLLVYPPSLVNTQTLKTLRQTEGYATIPQYLELWPNNWSISTWIDQIILNSKQLRAHATNKHHPQNSLDTTSQKPTVNTYKNHTNQKQPQNTWRSPDVWKASTVAVPGLVSAPESHKGSSGSPAAYPGSRSGGWRNCAVPHLLKSLI